VGQERKQRTKISRPSFVRHKRKTLARSTGELLIGTKGQLHYVMKRQMELFHGKQQLSESLIGGRAEGTWNKINGSPRRVLIRWHQSEQHCAQPRNLW